MAIATGITLEEYLAADYQPDCEYADGKVLARNVGEGPHSYTQIALGAWFYASQKTLGLIALSEQRVQISKARFRVPDLCVIKKEDFAKIIGLPPLLCVEILSPEDRWNRLQESIDDYLQFGVPEVWVIDPQNRKAWICARGSEPRLIIDGVLRWNNLTIELREILPPETTQP